MAHELNEDPDFLDHSVEEIASKVPSFEQLEPLKHISSPPTGALKAALEAVAACRGKLNG